MNRAIWTYEYVEVWIHGPAALTLHKKSLDDLWSLVRTGQEDGWALQPILVPQKQLWHIYWLVSAQYMGDLRSQES
jgi:hypothetical protein